MQQLESIDIEKLTYYKGHKIFINNTIKYMRVNQKERIIEINSNFFKRLSNNQKFFLLEWHIRRKRYKNDLDCDRVTYNYCIKKGINPDEIMNLYKFMQIRNKFNRQQRINNLLTPLQSSLILKISNLWKKIKNLLKH